MTTSAERSPAASAVPAAAAALAAPAPKDGPECVELNRKRSLFLDFLESAVLAGQPAPSDENYLVELLKSAPAQLPTAELINDLSGTSPFAAAAASAAAPAKTAAAPAAPEPAAAAAAPQPPAHHRAVITAMPALTRAASGAKALPDDDDTASVVTLPMPDRKRRRSDEDDEAASSPNDLVEMPPAPAAAAAAATTTGGRRVGRAAAASAAAAIAAHMAADAHASNGRDQAAAAAGGGTSAAAAGAPADAAATGTGERPAPARRGILVSKVLTKSDATSKRIILPRIAVETNLPQLASAPLFHFTAIDPSGGSWPLVIKAWANGSNPKPVFVLEQIGEVLKANKLGVGDAVALLGDEDSRFFLEWNTPGAAAAAARPTASGVVFRALQQAGAGGGKGKGKSSAAAAPAAAAPAASPRQTQQQQPAATAAASAQPPRAITARADQPTAAPQQQPQQPQLQPAARVLSLAGAGSFPLPEIEQGQQLPQHLLTAAAAGRQQQPEEQQQQAAAAAPAASEAPFVMTAVPVTSPQVPGTFIPTSPCQLLVMGHQPAHDLEADLEGSLQPSLPASLLGGGGEPGGDALVAPGGGNVLLCPRTAGCTRPAGHQGWCLGHKGYRSGNKRQRT